MAEQGLLALFDEEPVPAAKPARAPLAPRPAPAVPRPVEDPTLASALAYEAATLDALASFEDGDVRDQKEACIRFSDAMEAYMALPRLDYQRGQRELRRRGKIGESDWRLVQSRMLALMHAS
jgi:hypothetical protein